MFFDDILIYSPSWLTHLEHLQLVLHLLNAYQQFVKLFKCSFGLNEVEYLGHTVSGQWIKMDKHKIQVVLECPTPTNVKQFRGFLGLTRYYRRFIKSYAPIASPLTDLLRKDNFSWSPWAQSSFLTLKQATTSTSMLVLSNVSQPFVLEIVASDLGIGVVLSQ